jgi:peptidoglycan/xylan/chitin deacetylase (PgdA/CDA1 family)
MLKSFLIILMSVLGLMSSQKAPRKFLVHITPTVMVTVAPSPAPIPTDTTIPSPTDRGIHVPILLWHYISENPNKSDIARDGLSTAPAIFEQQLQTLKSNGFTPISFDELAAGFNGAQLPPKPVILTFDDGYEDFYLNAYPLLTKYQMKGTEFIPTGLIGGGLFMTWGQIEEMSHSPYVTFESHSIHHYYMTKISFAAIVQEAKESKQILESHIGYTVNWFCYPYGAFNNQVVAEVKQAGYIGGITTMQGSWQYQSRFFSIPRYRAGTRTGESLLSLVK